MKIDIVRAANVNGNQYQLRPGDVLDDRIEPRWLIDLVLKNGYGERRTSKKKITKQEQ